MTRMDRKALPIAIALLLALGVSQSASAFTITNLSGFDTLSYQLKSSDLNLSGWSYEEGTGSSRYTSYWFGLWSKRFYPSGTTVPVPEPSSALVLGLGLFAASRFARRKR
jgi:hypothetical protein